MRTILSAIILISIFLNSNIRSEHAEESVEQRALIFIIQSLQDTSGFDSPLLPSNFAEDMMNMKHEKFYSNGLLCMVSEPSDYFDVEDIGFDKEIVRDLISQWKRLKADYTSQRFNLPANIQLLSFTEFEQQNDQESFFFIARNHLSASNVEFVQIHVIPLKNTNDPFKYTFSIYFKDDRVYKFDCQMEAFEYDILIDC